MLGLGRAGGGYKGSVPSTLLLMEKALITLSVGVLSPLLPVSLHKVDALLHELWWLLPPNRPPAVAGREPGGAGLGPLLELVWRSQRPDEAVLLLWAE